MKAYTFHKGVITPGIAVSTHPKFGPVISLGAYGRGCKQESVSLCRSVPPQVLDGKVFEARFETITVNQGRPNEYSFQVLRRAYTPVQDILLRVNTEWPNTGCSNGNWVTWTNRPTYAFKGWGRRNVAGRFCTWDDGLVVLHPGDALLITPEGLHRDAPYLVSHSARGPICVPKRELAQIVPTALAS